MASTDIASLFRVDGKRALVTGASSGLGAHFARLLASAGAQVILAARREDRLVSLQKELEAAGAIVATVALDVGSRDSVQNCFEQIGAPDIVVNNAGVTVTRPLLEQTEADWDTVIDTNLKGCWMVATEAARRMVAAAKGGSIVNVASILGERVASAVAPYAISKAGVLQATRAMALELARHQIRVNALMPGYVATELNSEFLSSEAGDRLRLRVPSRKFGQLTDLDGPLLLLASDAGRGMTGSMVAVDHGHLVSSL